MAEQTIHVQAALDEIRDARAHSCDQFCTEGGCDFDLAGFVDRVDEILARVALAVGSSPRAQAPDSDRCEHCSGELQLRAAGDMVKACRSCGVVAIRRRADRPPDLWLGDPRPGLVRLADLDLRDQHGQQP